MAALRPAGPNHDTPGQDAGAPQAVPPPPTWRRWLNRWVPRTLFGRLALLLFVAVLASHVLALTLMFNLHDLTGHGPPPPPQGLQEVADGATAEESVQPGALRLPGPPGPGQHGPPSLWDAGLLLDIGVRLSALMVAAWVGARWLSKPIDRLALAARELGKNIDRPPLSEDGPAECKEAIQVFNQMQARIRQQLEERDRFVAAVSHDLRTPLTRLRLRAETLESSEDRRQFGRDIVEMDEMITATLDHLRGVADPEPMVQLDVKALVDSLADDQQACGHWVPVHGRAGLLPAQAGALRRCVGNLIGNAIRYGGQTEVFLWDTGDEVGIEVRDHGPGLPEAELERVMAPFYRVEGSRNRHHGGVGLGLSIARDIVARHQGRLQLRNAAGGGLLAIVVLPRLPQLPVAA
ncbi:MAG: HAMP domain-containing protein [Curvibacter lanceolatus]|uniref:ATP-binding protein n=1 Tax=Curvibacter lanceolatus TaxID=86182 RepID=UPI002354B568|nr:ATP-binding protein [Curvibacter lanceolatus]MBV5292116.1 HAMP domain-containing protein [Curvibacter lanceolatus]